MASIPDALMIRCAYTGEPAHRSSCSRVYSTALYWKKPPNDVAVAVEIRRREIKQGLAHHQGFPAETRVLETRFPTVGGSPDGALSFDERGAGHALKKQLERGAVVVDDHQIAKAVAVQVGGGERAGVPIQLRHLGSG